MRRQFFCFIILISLACRFSHAASELQFSTPAEQGIDASSMRNFVNAILSLEGTEVHHLVVLRHGVVITQVHPTPFKARDTHTLYSASKTLTALAVGCAIDENRLRLNDRVAAFFPELTRNGISPEMASITVRDLLTMHSGVTPDWTMRNNDDHWTKTWLAKAVTDPGVFQYDSMCSYMLAAVVQKATGTTMMDYLQRKLLTPMGITTAQWEQSPEGVNTGGWGLRMNSLDQAKLGQLMLQRGAWDGVQLISQQWIDEATKKQVECNTTPQIPLTTPSEGNQGYGYQVWRCSKPGAFRADGAFAQYIVVDPETDIVVVFNGVSTKGHDILRAIWQWIVPAARRYPVPAIGALQKKLDKTIARAAIEPPKGKKHPGGRLKKASRLKAVTQNHEMGIDSIVAQWQTGNTLGVSIYHSDGTTTSFPCLHHEWERTTTTSTPPYSIAARGRFSGLDMNFTIAGAYAWHDDTLTIKALWTDWISGMTLTLSPNGGELLLNYAPKKPIALTCE